MPDPPELDTAAAGLLRAGWSRLLAHVEVSCALQVRDDLVNGVLQIALITSWSVASGSGRTPRRTKDLCLAIDPVTCAMISEHLNKIRAKLAALGLELLDDACVFSNDPMGARPWNPDWATHKASDLAAAVGVKLNIKGLRHYTASQLLAARFDPTPLT